MTEEETQVIETHQEIVELLAARRRRHAIIDFVVVWSVIGLGVAVAITMVIVASAGR